MNYKVTQNVLNSSHLMVIVKYSITIIYDYQVYYILNKIKIIVNIFIDICDNLKEYILYLSANIKINDYLRHILSIRLINRLIGTD